MIGSKVGLEVRPCGGELVLEGPELTDIDRVSVTFEFVWPGPEVAVALAFDDPVEITDEECVLVEVGGVLTMRVLEDEGGVGVGAAAILNREVVEVVICVVEGDVVGGDVVGGGVLELLGPS